ncbi:MAG: FkbM family methyltransferase [Gammaproteobacteria bacterium]
MIADVGAHAGQFSKIFSKLVPKGEVYAFEPASYARSILERVIAAHRLRNVRVVPLGLGDQSARRTLRIPLKASGSLGFGLSHVVAAQQDALRPSYEEEIEIVPLDDFVAEYGIDRLDLIKADVEGWEMRLLAGAEKTLATLRPVLILEADPNFLERAGDSLETLWDFLTGLSYSICRLGRPQAGHVPVEVAPEPCSGDILCLPGTPRASA